MTCKSINAAVSIAALSAAGLGWAAPAEAQAPAKAAATEIVVIGARERLATIPGSGATVELEDLERARVLTVNEALRQIPGIVARDEEGFGVRPNIGVRGLNPTRSTEITLLEDGIPLAYAPYGDNASYSHPPLRRFERIEALKGASQIRFGPHTVGGVINYVTPKAPEELKGRITIAAGSEGYREADVMAGGAIGEVRLIGHFNALDFDTARANQNLSLRDYFVKAEYALTPQQDIVVRAGLFEEKSQVTYSGLTEAEFRAAPFSNPFKNDEFTTERATAAITHSWRLGENFALTTSLYSLWFDRDWWRQSSNSGQRPNDSSDPSCGGMANLDTTCGNEGRLREYNTYGVETRAAWSTSLAGAALDAEAGLRWHTERQNRQQLNGDSPRARTPGTSVNAGVRENELRYADALSAFAAARVDFGRFALSPGVRFETIEYERLNRLNTSRGATDLDEIIPGLGATFDLTEAVTLFAGAHRGFSPPAVADVITGAGGSVTLEPEKSTNYEAGVKARPAPGLTLEAAAYVMDFDNQIVPASVAGGVGATLTSAGATRHSGVEASMHGSLRDMGRLTTDDVFFRAALNYLPEAEYRGRRFSNVGGFSTTSVTGNRLPYAPEFTASAALGYGRGDWLTAQVEVQHIGEQFTDDLNTVAPTANGQRGLIEAATFWNAALNLRRPGTPLGGYVTVKNIFDELAIADRSRGILPAPPRLVQVGVEVTF
jgi:Fe(3+) dicitrate transport protein